jgi:predicted RNase H-like HicB family nuclease
MKYTVEFDKEEDGRWIAEVMEISGALVYGNSKDEALAKAEALTLRVLAEKLENGEKLPEELSISFKAA